MSRISSVLSKSGLGRAIALFLVALLTVALVSLAGITPQQALASSSLRAGSIDGSETESAQVGEDGSLSLQPQAMSKSDLLSSTVRFIEDENYSDGKITISAGCNPSTGYYVVIIGVVGGTWLKVPESFQASVAAECLAEDAAALFEDYKTGGCSEEAIAVLDYMCESGWKNESSLTLKDLSNSNEIAPVTGIMNISRQESDFNHLYNSYWQHDGYEGIKTLSFEETSTAASLPCLKMPWAFYDCDDIASITFPEFRRYRLSSTFWGCDGLESIKLVSSDSHDWDGSHDTTAFKNCSNLQQVDLSDFRGIISSGMFDNCPKLRLVEFGEEITDIDADAFRDCTSLESVDFPDSLEWISSEAFDNCTSLKNITWPNNPNFTTVDGFYGCTSLGSDVIETLPASVTSIGNHTPRRSDINATGRNTHHGFANCGFTSLNLPDSITTIGSYAFYGCSGLDGQTITIPSGVTTIGHKAFSLSVLEGDTPASITLNFENPDFTFTPIEGGSTSALYRMADSNDSTSATAFYNPFGNTYVTLYASETGANGGTSLLKQAFDTYYVYEEADYSDGTADLMSERTLPGDANRNEYQFGAKPELDIAWQVTGTVPSQASVIVTRDGRPVAVTMTAEGGSSAFVAEVVEGADVQVRVSLNGFADKTFEKAADAFTANWNACNLTADSFTATTGSKPSGAIYQYTTGAIVYGRPFVAELHYSLPSASSTGVATISLPAGSTLYSVANETRRLGVSSSGSNQYAVPITGQSGKLFARLVLATDGASTIGGTISCNGAWDALTPLSVSCERVTILECDSVAIGGLNRMVVATAPGADVTLKIGQTKEIASTTANSVGTAVLAFNLPESLIDEGLVGVDGVNFVVAANGGTVSKKIPLRSRGIRILDWSLERSGISYSLAEDNLLSHSGSYSAFSGSFVPGRFSGDLSDAYWPFKATIETDEPLTSPVQLQALGTSRGLLFSIPMTVVSEEVVTGGWYRYTLVGTYVDQTFLTAYELCANGGDCEYHYLLPGFFLLTDGDELNALAFKSPIIDPSGTVFEAVPGNVLAGVTATIRLADDELGTNARNWTEAPDYDQATSMLTDANGAYAWDVPEGWWQVAFSKEGYVSTATEWMEVQPPRVGLRTALVSTALPTVSSVNAYSGAIEIEFSQYMKTGSTAATDEYSGVAVTIDGVAVPASRLQWVDSEESLEGELLSRTLRVNAPTNSPYSGTVTVGISGARNYVGNAMEGSADTSISVEAQKPSSLTLANALDTDVLEQLSSSVIEAAGLVGQATVYVGSGSGVPVSVTLLDSEGQPMTAALLNVLAPSDSSVLVSSSDIAPGATETTVITDENGVATAYVFGATPGVTRLTVTVDGSSLTGEALVVATADSRSFEVAFDAGSGIVVSPASVMVEEGESVSAPDPAPTRTGYRLAYWYAGTDDSAVYDFAAAVTGPLELHAKWVKQWTVTASSADAQKGKVKIGLRDAAATDYLIVDEGEEVSVTAVPAEGYHFSSWSVNGTPQLGSQATFTKSNITANCTLVANFEQDVAPDNPDNPGSGDDPDNPGGGDNPDNPDTPDNPDNPGGGDNPDNPATTATITIVGADGGALVGGTVTGAGAHEIGSLVTLTAVPNQGYEFRGWKSDGNIELIPTNDVLSESTATILWVMATGDNEYLSTDSSIRFRVADDVTIQADFVATQSGSDPVVDPQPGIDDPESGDDPQPRTDNPEQGDSPSQGDDPSKSDDPEKVTDPEKASDSEQGKDSEKETSATTTDNTTKATSTVTTKADAAKGSSTPATGDMALTFAINTLSVVVLTAFLFIAFRRRTQ